MQGYVTAPDGQKLMYIRVHYFSSEATRVLRNAVSQADGEGAVGIIFDLRNNPGQHSEPAILEHMGYSCSNTAWPLCVQDAAVVPMSADSASRLQCSFTAAWLSIAAHDCLLGWLQAALSHYALLGCCFLFRHGSVLLGLFAPTASLHHDMDIRAATAYKTDPCRLFLPILCSSQTPACCTPNEICCPA